MLRRWLRTLCGVRPAPAPKDLLFVPRERVEHLWQRVHGLPRVDWRLAALWIARQTDEEDPAKWRRAIMGACLDELRDSLTTDHRRWRSAHVEGLAPLEGPVGQAVSTIAEQACTRLRQDLRRIRGDAAIPPVAIVLIQPTDAYVNFVDSYFPEEGAFAMTGGLYLNDGAGAFPLIAVNASAPHGCAAAVVHELTHHCLHGCAIPIWAEEGLTQMMEERLHVGSGFELSAEWVERHRTRWSEVGIDAFVDGSAFLSPERDTQELAYHLAQWVVRGELTRRPDRFFTFLAHCRDQGPDPAFASALGGTPTDLINAIVFGTDAAPNH